MKKLRDELINEIKKELSNYPLAKKCFELTVSDKRVIALLEQANTVAVGRLNYNDHGIVHALLVCRNAIKIAKILKDFNIVFDIEREKIGNFEDVLITLILSSILHDTGNAVHRSYHNLISAAVFAKEIVSDILKQIYSNNLEKQIKISCEILHCIISHMYNEYPEFFPISLEAMVIAMADGLDMEEGRARIPYKLGKSDIHAYSALAIKEVKIEKGKDKPILVKILMKNPAGIFQVQEVLWKKIHDKLKNLVRIEIKIESNKDIIVVEKDKWHKTKDTKNGI